MEYGGLSGIDLIYGLFFIVLFLNRLIENYFSPVSLGFILKGKVNDSNTSQTLFSEQQCVVL